jgi:hypothetical protein
VTKWLRFLRYDHKHSTTDVVSCLIPISSVEFSPTPYPWPVVIIAVRCFLQLFLFSGSHDIQEIMLALTVNINNRGNSEEFSPKKFFPVGESPRT